MNMLRQTSLFVVDHLEPSGGGGERLETLDTDKLGGRRILLTIILFLIWCGRPHVCFLQSYITMDYT